MDRQHLDAYRVLLKTRLAEIAAADRSTATARAPVVLDQQSVGRLSRMDAIQQQSMAKAAKARRQSDLRRIQAALKRMEDGEFGYCTQCGGEIEKPRLDADPSIFWCISCMRS